MKKKCVDTSKRRQLRWPLVAGLVALFGCLFAMATQGSAYANTLVGGAAESDSIVVECTAPDMRYADSSAAPDDSKALFDAYAEKRLQEALPQKNNLAVQAVPNPDLTEPEKKLLTKLKELVAEVAAGSQQSTEFQIALSDLGVAKTSWTPEQLGVSSGLVEGYPPQEVYTALIQQANVPDIGKVVKVLLADCPYELYWYDKTRGIRYGYFSFVPNQDGISWSKVILSDSITINMEVVDSYKGDKAYTVSIRDSERITQAIESANSIAKSNTNKSTLERLQDYKDYICDKVSYGKGSFTGSYGDPWQIIAVFDNNDKTEAVCEGYAKAFQYLVDLSEFEDGTYSYLVTGTMSGGTGAGAHMWNVVHMNDGKNYLVDVTNCDEGTIGATDKLFMAVGPRGNLKTGYRFLSNSIKYEYDSETRSLYGDEALRIYAEPVTMSQENTAISISGSYEYNGSGQVPKVDAVKVFCNNELLEYGEEYTFSDASLENNVNAGDATLIVTGKGRYSGEVTGTFTIGQKSVTVKANDATKVEGSADPSWSATVSGLLNGDKVNYALACNHSERPGTYEITATGEINQGNYAVSYESGRFVIKQNNTQNQDPDTPTGADDPTSSNTNSNTQKSNNRESGKEQLPTTTPSSSATTSVENSTTSDPATKADNPMSVSKKSKKVKLAKVKKKKQVISGIIVVTNAAGPVTFSKIAKGSDKKLAINKKTGKITVKKGCKKGKHKINVLVTALGDENHNPATAIVQATIIVK